MRINGEKVFLTAITYDDCEDFIRWRNSDFIKSRFIYRKDITIEQQRKWIETKVLTGKVAQFIIWDRLDKKKIGSVYLQNIDKDKKEAEYGVLIGEKEYTGRGLGTESANLIIRYGFEQLNLEKIYLRVLKNNLPARKAYEKVGFKEESKEDTIIIDGNGVEVLFMSINKNEV